MIFWAARSATASAPLLIDISAMSAYNQNINIEMDEQVNAYATDEKDFETAMQDFKNSAVDLYPEITAD